jgi:hypothetical protein
MKIGTKSLLFGCHQFLWHPLTVALAYRKLFRRWPDSVGCLCILVHDWGYWGCGDIDGKEGKLHPLLGAKLAGKIVYRLRRIFCRESKLASVLLAAEASERCLLHSGSLAEEVNMSPSDICWADKFSLFYEPEWFYLLRTRLSGEMVEFKHHAVVSGHVSADATDLEWLHWFKDHLCARPEITHLLSDSSAFRNYLLLRYSPRALKGWTNQFEKTPGGLTARAHVDAHRG